MAEHKSLGQQFEQIKKDTVQYLERLDKQLSQYPGFDQVEKVSGGKVKPSHVAVAAVAVGGLVALLGFGARAAINLVGFIYPLYASMKAINSDDKDDDTMWLSYWVIYAFFTVFESLFDLALGWMPLYFFAKLGFLAFCFMPQTKGAQLVYNKVLNPVFVKYSPQVDAAAAKISKKTE
jgi:receptor expression-enhancing protein 5/6